MPVGECISFSAVISWKFSFARMDEAVISAMNSAASLLGYTIIDCVAISVEYLLGERSEPHTGVFNRDFA